MNITIIYGSMIKANTYDCVQLLLNNLKSTINIQTTEIFLPKNSLYYEYSSNYKSYMRKFHATRNIGSIAKSIINSDLIIFACPVISCDISKKMKEFLNTLSLYMKNNALYPLNNKIGIAISTTAGAGLFQVIKTLEKNLNFLGINNTFKFSQTIYELNFEYISIKTKNQINKNIMELSHNILNTYSSLQQVNSSLPPANLPLFIESASAEASPDLKNKTCDIINFNFFKKHKYYHGN